MTENVRDNHYIAVIGDIKDSRKIVNRKEIQEKFRVVLDELNKKYADDIASNFMITLGDSFQGLLINKQLVFRIIFEIELAMAPVEFRFGIGIGEISTTIQRTNTMEMDGSAYHRARQMIDLIEENEKKYNQSETNMMIRLDDKNEQVAHLLNAVLSLGTALKSKWTDRQKEVIYTYIMSDENQYKTAELLGIGQSSVNKALNVTKYYTYKKAMLHASSFLSQLGEGI